MKEMLILKVIPDLDERTKNIYPTIAEAIQAAHDIHTEESSSEATPDYTPVTIMITEGIYHERLEIHTPCITLCGTGKFPADTVITHGDYAQAIHADGEKYGTFRTPTLFIDANEVAIKNLTVENSAGSGPSIGQALAVYADGDMLTFEKCRLLGHQDTLFTAPLPPNPYQKNGFRGPKEFAPRTEGRHYYKNCYICGTVDFIFGSAAAYFEGCELFSVCRDKGGGYVTAASTPEGARFGYIFNRCRFTSDCPADSVYLGRPWRDYAKVVILNSYLGEHIKKSGWHDWNKPQAHDTVYYAEYNNYGPGAATDSRADFARILTADKAETYDICGDSVFEALAGKF